ncbi:bifunctional proline dehydrogenase/L-glutamate gamma-semialdehyde dehydrogenase [Nesterenkonia sp. DZ6]|uniref:bifunctional proline dehydrogenase/L-glutamate gamma-semialdehyde dehydrogenase n=1 Tax=Nesterenkonia sp. DZ6 TaxID=2901229 RepID=UPI001F4D0BB6|nr:bifunctional proline dehydrogenase/L-glutamate gamma-semialdehyde dehydrogenase [Nesterenkonia sp. DZ6]MCH8560042.1 bifunctional proline dehydrogenase/L-glutamate gamma-semialdehyde dehydrogenase [Nesterenkonia sp. DZ6]
MSTQNTAELTDLSEAAVSKVTRWLQRGPGETGSSKPSKPSKQSKNHAAADKSAQRLSAVLSHPNGLDFTVGFVDRVIRTEDTRAAASALAELGGLAPDTLSSLDRAQIRAGSALAKTLPDVVVPAARARMRSMVGHMVVDARDKPFGKAVASIKQDGHRLNINLLGEAVLGEAEADKHLQDTVDLLRRDDVDYVSIKVSSIASQISMWGFEQTVDYVVARLIPMYQEAAKAPAGSKFINLDMEEYRDLNLTIAVFKTLLSRPELKHYEGGIVLQAYLPDALGATQELAQFANARVAAGGAGIKIRLVKGANLAVEKVHGEIAGWPQVTCESKEATDANYKLVLHWLLTEENMAGVRIGVAGHNLFDIAFAHLLGAERGVTGQMEFEMLQGMATEQAEAVSADVGQLLLYVPAVRPAEFDVAISYLVRRLEENAASENFMSGIFELEVDGSGRGSEVFEREAQRFRDSLALLEEILSKHGHTAPGPQHTQDRSLEERQGAEVLSSAGELKNDDAAAALPPFVNEPDTDPALPANQRWAADAVARASQPGWLEGQSLPEKISGERIDELVAQARAAAEPWAARPAVERARILYRAADILAARRGHLVSIAAAEVGKSVAQTDPEISEAIDFARYYAHSALEIEQVEHARFIPDRLVLITPPWNFPLAIPAGGTFAALAAGAAVIHKPSNHTPHCSMAILDALWDAGVPREVLHGVYPFEGADGKRLVSHDGIDRVILTGASETAAMFRSWKPALAINAETSGKNALIVTPSADRDLAVADLVTSAFGHAGQKCSAASLGILVGSVYDSERFRRQLVDAASSMVVDWPSSLAATVGPLTEEPSEKLRRALTTLEPGESWLLEPRQLDDTGLLWSPGIKDGVKPGSFFHLTEVFGPVLGLMEATDLDEAIAAQNQVDFGLTGGIHSLEPAEVSTWLDRVQVGNAYVNRGITGAIVQRQSFGGWKQSSVGLGSKAGGPNYVMLFGRWEDDMVGAAAPAGGSARAVVEESVGRLMDSAVSSGIVSGADRSWLAAAAADDQRWWEAEFGQPADRTGLESEANIFRYLGEDVLLRVGVDATAVQLLRALVAAQRAGADVSISAYPKLPPATAKALELGRRTLKLTVTQETTGQFSTALAAGVHDRGVGVRVRVLGAVDSELRMRLAERPEVALIADEVTASGRVELRYWLKEQAVSMTLHRFGNPARDFHRLAQELKRPVV